MKLWNDFTKVLITLFGPKTIQQWLQGLKLVKYDEKNIYLEAKDSFQILWFKEHIIPIAQKKLLTQDGKPYRIHIQQKEINPSQQKLKQKLAAKYRQVVLSDFFSFENFIPSQQNHLTYEILTKLSKTLSIEANPIYLSGDIGTGKTHLLQALALALRKKKLIPLYITTQLFTENFVKALRSNDMTSFRKFYRSFDALIVDDIEILTHKPATQEEFFHTFNHYHSQQKPIILSSKLSPKSLTDIEERLTSRFEWGLVLHLKPLLKSDFELFFQLKEKEFGITFEKNAREYLLTYVSHISDLSLILQMLFFKTKLAYNSHINFSLPMIRPIIEKVIEKSKKHFSQEHIINSAAHYFGLTKELLLSSSKTKNLIYPRRICMYLMRVYAKKTFMQIGQFFSKDHSTIVTGINDISKKISSQDKKAEEDIQNLLIEIKKPN